MASFLDEKFPPLEALEEEHLSLLQERSDMITKRRRRDDEDDLDTVFGTPPTYVEEDLDNFGRPMLPTLAKELRTTARESRRARRERRPRYQLREDGFSTDSSLPPDDKTDYDEAVKQVVIKGKNILGDVKAKDFRNPTLGLAKWFGEWREKFGESYVGAWGGLGMVGAWEFWTRLEILGWDPIRDKKPMDLFEWYKSLHKYSRPPQTDDEMMMTDTDLGPEGDLVSAMISTTIIPRVVKLLEKGALDPYSDRDVRRLVELCEEIEISVPMNHLKFEVCLPPFEKCLFSSN